MYNTVFNSMTEIISYNTQTDTWYFDVAKLIEVVYSSGGILRLYNEDVTMLDTCMTELIAIDKDGYDDGYSKNIDTNLTIKLTGLDFERFLEKFTHGKLRRNSAGIFSSKKEYEYSTDFVASTYKDGREQPLEAKNCKSMSTFANTRTHRTLYVIANDRENKTFHLLCKVGQNNDDSEATKYSSATALFKEIKDWYWLQEARENYEAEGMANSWQIIRGTDSAGNYIELRCPKFIIN